jgi:hypothetical protein
MTHVTDTVDHTDNRLDCYHNGLYDEVHLSGPGLIWHPEYRLMYYHFYDNHTYIYAAFDDQTAEIYENQPGNAAGDTKDSEKISWEKGSGFHDETE